MVVCFFFKYSQYLSIFKYSQENLSSNLHYAQEIFLIYIFNLLF